MLDTNQVSDYIRERSQILEALEIIEVPNDVANVRTLLLNALFPKNQSLRGGCLFFILRTLTAPQSLDILDRFKRDNAYALRLAELLRILRDDTQLFNLLEPNKFITRTKKVKARIKDAERGPQSNLCELLLTPLGESPKSSNNWKNQSCEPQLLCLAIFTLLKSLQFEDMVQHGAQDKKLLQLTDQLRKLSDLNLHPDYTEHTPGSAEERWWRFSKWLGDEPSLCKPQSFALYTFDLSARLTTNNSKKDTDLFRKLIHSALDTIQATSPEITDCAEGLAAITPNIRLETLASDPSVTYISMSERHQSYQQQELEIQGHLDESQEEKTHQLLINDEKETVVLRELSDHIYNPDFISFFPTNIYWSPEKFNSLLAISNNTIENREPINEVTSLLIWLTAETGLTGESLVDLILGKNTPLGWRISEDGCHLERARFARQTSIITISNRLTPLSTIEKRQLPGVLLGLVSQLRAPTENELRELRRQVSALTRNDTGCYLLGRQLQGIPQPLSLLLYTNNPNQLPANTSYYCLIDTHPVLKRLGIQAQDQNRNPSNILGSPFHIEEKSRERFILEKMHLLRTTKGNAIEQFNNIALFCTSLILIFTGARPNEDPFDDPENLGLDSHLILIGDKIIDERAPFRLAPLPEPVCLLIKNLWLSMLDQIGSATKNHEAAESLNRISRSLAPKGLPLFFQLCDRSRRGWRSITPKDLSNSWGGDLPGNIFRHNFAAMCQGVVHQDCIDYVLGHSQLGIQPYSITSSRILLEDFDTLRKAFNDLAIKLTADAKQIDHTAISELIEYCDTQLECGEGTFGVSKRLSRKKDLHAIAQTQASQIVEQIKKEELDTFGTRELEKFFEKFPMFYPSPGTYLKTLNIFANELQKEFGSICKLRQTQLPNVLAPSFTSAVLSGQKKIHECIKSLETAFATFNGRSSRLSLIGAILRIIFIHGLTQKRLIQKLLQNRWKIFNLAQYTYLNFLADVDHREMDRIKIDQITSSMLAASPGQSAVKTLTDFEIKSIKEILPSDMWIEKSTDDMLELLSPALELISQINWMRLPGFGAAAVNGEILTFCDSDNSLIWRNAPGFELLNRTSSDHQPTSITSKTVVPKKSEVSLGRELEEISLAIRKTDRNGREATLIELKKLSANAPDNSDYKLLCQYAILLLRRKNARSTRKHLTTNTVLRYCTSIRKFLQFAEHADATWLSMNQHEIQDLVNEHLGYLSRETAVEEIKHINEFLKCCFDFSGLKIPPWLSSLESKPRDTLVPEYLFKELLEISSNLAGVNKSLRVAVQTILILAYRYGLRSGEIEKLRHREVKLRGSIPIFHLYRSGKEHLKTTSANRIVSPISILPHDEITMLDAQIKSSTGIEDGLIFAQPIWRQSYTLALKIAKSLDSELDLHALREYRPTAACSIATLEDTNSQRQLELNSCLLGQARGSVLFGHSIKRQIGHSNYQTTLENYTKNICEISCERIAYSIGIGLQQGGQNIKKLPIKKREPADQQILIEHQDLHINKSTLLRLALAIVFEGREGTDRYHSLVEQNLVSAMNRLCLPLLPKLFPQGLQRQAKAKGMARLPKTNQSAYRNLQHKLHSLGDNEFLAAIRELRNATDPNLLLTAHLTNQGSLYFKNEEADCNVLLNLFRTLNLLGLGDCLLVKEGRDTDISKCPHLLQTMSLAGIEVIKFTKSDVVTTRSNDLSTINPYDQGTQRPYVIVMPRGKNTKDKQRQAKSSAYQPTKNILDKASFIFVIHFINLCMIDDAQASSLPPYLFDSDN